MSTTGERFRCRVRSVGAAVLPVKVSSRMTFGVLQLYADLYGVTGAVDVTAVSS
jgi:hypothetical protein